ncbi:MAG: hypothetical protein WAM39_14050 [Bryobacteraceae bacterium]
MKVTATIARSIAAAQEQAKEIAFSDQEKAKLRWAAGLPLSKMEDAVAFLAQKKPPPWVYAAWDFIRQCHLSPRHSDEEMHHSVRRRYRRRCDWTIREQTTAMAMATSQEYSVEEIARTVGRTAKAVRRKLARCAVRCAKPEGYSARQLADILQVHRRLIQRWEQLGLKRESGGEGGKPEAGSRKCRIEHEAVKEFFLSDEGQFEAEHLDVYSFRKLVELLGVDPLQQRYEEERRKAELKCAADAQRKREKRAAQRNLTATAGPVVAEDPSAAVARAG